MSKSDGLKIGIKFTEDLVGDVSGNINAFTITGKEYKYIDGVLIDKVYQVDKVERYPIRRVWGIEEQVKLDGEGNNEEQIGWNTVDFTTGNPSTGTRGYKFKVSENILITALRMLSTESTSTIHLWNTETQELLTSITSSTITGRWNTIALEIPVKLEQGVEYMVSANYTLGNNYYRNASANQGEFNSLLVYLGHFTGEAHNVIPTTSVVWANAVDILFTRIVEYITPKIFESESIQLTGNYRVRWQEGKPNDTNIVVECNTGESQGEWITIINGEVLMTDTNLWLRATLSTNDTSVAPTLKDLWLEESNAPQDRILLTLDWLGKFNNVIGDLTVSYDSTRGNLQGVGGAVESFNSHFTPTDLIQTPNPNIEEYISVAPNVSVILIPVEYHKGYEQHTITVSPVTVTATLTHTSIINP